MPGGAVPLRIHRCAIAVVALAMHGSTAAATTSERIEIVGSIASDGASGVIVPSEQAFDPCGGFGYVAATQTLGALAPPPYVPRQFAAPQNAWIALRFPFDVDDAKSRKSTFDLTSPATDNLSQNVTITDEFGNHVPVIPVLAGRTALGLQVALDPGFPYYPNAAGGNALAGKRALLLIADSEHDGMYEPGVFGAASGNPALSQIAELRVSVKRIGDHDIDGFWVVKIGDGGGHSAFPLAPLRVEACSATQPKKPIQFIGGNQVIDAASAFEVTFSEPVEPWSAGVGKQLAKSFGLTWKKNLKPTKHPCFASLTFPAGDPIIPNIELIADPDGAAKRLPFDLVAPSSNDLSRWRILPLGALPKGALEIRVKPISEGPAVHGGIDVYSAVTTPYGRAFDDTLSPAARFHVAAN